MTGKIISAKVFINGTKEFTYKLNNGQDITVEYDKYGLANITREALEVLLEVSTEGKEERAIQKEVNSALDEIRAEIEDNYGHCDICEYFEDYDYEDNNISEYRYVANVKDILQIIDKYKADKKDCTTCIGFGDKDYAQSFCHDCVKDIQNHYKADKGVEE